MADIMKSLEQWLFGENDLIDRMEAFAKERCDEFEYIADAALFEASENKLSYTPIFNEYQALFEAEIGAFLEKEGCSYDAFLAACGAADAAGEAGSVGMHDWLLAMAEFKEFKALMLGAKKAKVENA
jgi:hypothetical protein